MKSRILPKFCVKVDWYLFFHFFLKFFSFLANGVKCDLKKKNSFFFLTTLTFLVRHRFWVSKNGKRWLFSTFFPKIWKVVFCQRYRIFLFPGIAYIFTLLVENRVSEWKRCIFFPVLFFFFSSSPWKRVSEWVVNFSREKKNKYTFLPIYVGKKKHRKSEKTPISQGELPLSRVGGFQTFPEKKKNNLYFFFSKKWKKKTAAKFLKIEWVSGVKLFQGNTKIRYLWFCPNVV